MSDSKNPALSAADLIKRFREGKPTSREERKNVSKETGAKLWWEEDNSNGNLEVSEYPRSLQFGPSALPSRPNDILQDNSVVTAKIKVTSEGLDMYNLNGIVVSESHIIKCFGNWIPVKKHPLAIKIDKYDELYLYCLNTSSKTIVLNSITFTDWDEVYDGNLDFLYKYISSKNISKALDKGLTKDTKIKMKMEMKMENEYKCLKVIKIGDILSSNAIVYGIVELKNLGNKEPLLNLLVSNGLVETNSETYLDYNGNIDSILKLKKILSNEYV